MASIAHIKGEIEEIQTLKYISSAFTEASAAKIRAIKDTFERNRLFYEEISHLYDLVEYNADLLKKTTPSSGHLPATSVQSEKNLSIAITSNQRFYGAVNVNIMQSFVKDEASTGNTLVIIGSTGKDYMKSIEFSRPYESVQFVKDSPTKEEIQKISQMINLYDKVYLYYPKFVTLISQTVGKIDITHRKSKQTTIAEEEVHAIFEPEIKDMLAFFEEQVRATLFLRVLLETDLARTAARLLSMTSAEENAGELLKEQQVILRKLISSRINTEQLEKFSGMSLWKEL